ncbi:MAG: radical SAM protein [Clostridia bacterium]|nr:radical SAM protein [Clostridia bacterium]
MSHSNISIFVPHLGCPHQCSFCNQKHITGQSKLPNAQDVEDAVNIAITSKKYDKDSCEIAFFGGSFTAIDRDYMLLLLKTAYQFIKNGQVSGIRISTRPDCIDNVILTILKQFGVTAIELGAQSMNDFVLEANNRGHRAEDVVKASKLIKEFGFSLGLQMMTGLFKSSEADDLYTADKIIELQPDTVRIYPTITIKNTYLEKLYTEGSYAPQTLESAVALATKIEDKFINNNINVIRVGLHSIEAESYVAGPWHPAFRELCDSLRCREQLAKALSKKAEYIVRVNDTELSKFIGQKRSNIKHFEDLGFKIKFIPDNTVNKSDFIIEEVK